MSSTISCAVRSSASDRTAPTGRRDLSCVDQTGRGELILGEVLRAALGLKLITRIGDVAIGVGELEGVDAEIGQCAKADWGGLLGCEERLGDRMRLEEFLERRRLRSIRPACGDGEQEVAEFSRGGGGEPVIGMGDEIGIGAVGKMELHRQAARAGIRIGIGDRGNASKVGKPDGDRDRRALQMGRLAETGRLRTRREFAFERLAAQLPPSYLKETVSLVR
jgi:hypothetical protein